MLPLSHCPFFPSYQICKSPQAFLGGDVWLYHSAAEGCRGPIQFSTYKGNPPVNFDGIDDPTILPTLVVPLSDADVVPMDTDFFGGKEPPIQRIRTTKPLSHTLCTQLDSTRGGPVPVVFAEYQSQYWIHDPRVVLLENSLGRPLMDGGGTVRKETARSDDKYFYQALCSNVPRTWQNEKSCRLSQHSQVCGSSLSSQNQPLEIKLDSATLKLFYTLTHSISGGERARYVYAMLGLRLEDDDEAPPPCQPLARSRWISRSSTEADCTKDSTQNPQTSKVLSHLITSFGDGTGSLRDIYFPARSDSTCHPDDVATKGLSVFANGTCWHQVHPNHWQVYDLTMWLNAHPGGSDKIAQFAETLDSEFLLYPDNHDMQRWQTNRDRFPNLGRLGDTIRFQDLNRELRTSQAILKHFFPQDFASGDGTSVSSVSTVVCGSPGEVANDLTANGETLRGAFSVYTEFNNTNGRNDNDKQTVWMTVALTAPDQLRQRMAWALSQILVRFPLFFP